MVSILSLWLPIIISAIFVFIVSSIIHMLLPYHRSDYKKVPDEDGILDALSKFKISPGDYVIPHAATSEEYKSEEHLKKLSKGPVGFFTVVENKPPNMAQSMIQWFIYLLIVGLFSGYITSRALADGGDYMAVFRFVGTTSFMGYALALSQSSIWYKKAWSITLKNSFDGLVYALVTAGTFAWLWPV